MKKLKDDGKEAHYYDMDDQIEEKFDSVLDSIPSDGSFDPFEVIKIRNELKLNEISADKFSVENIKINQKLDSVFKLLYDVLINPAKYNKNGDNNDN